MWFQEVFRVYVWRCFECLLELACHAPLASARDQNQRNTTQSKCTWGMKRESQFQAEAMNYDVDRSINHVEEPCATQTQVGLQQGSGTCQTASYMQSRGQEATLAMPSG